VSNQSVHHDTFVIERTYPSPPSSVFRALTDPEVKAAWFLPPSEWKVSGYRFDSRVGGTEHAESRPPGGEPHVYDAVYHDMVPDRRVVFSYDMHLGEQHLSVSLATIELFPVDEGTRLTFTEQGAYLDGDPSSATSRVEGTHLLLDNLGKAVVGEDMTTAG
jgi:uncharacterized protein YndB with AHSA1/START domain